jgi:hypothetical protein
VSPGKARGISLISTVDVTVRNFAITGGLAGAKSEPIFLKNNTQAVIELLNVNANGGGGDAGGFRVDGVNPGLRVVNSIIWNNQKSGLVIGSGGSTSAAPIEIVNNTFFGNVRDGVSVGENTVVIIENNLFVSNGVSNQGKGFYGIRTASRKSQATLANNVVYANGGGAGGDLKGTTAASSGNLTTDGVGVLGCVFASCTDSEPLTAIFVDPATADFHLVATSPAIDAGTSSGPAPSPPEDFEGQTRDSDPDAGYDELPLDLDFDLVFDFEDNCPPEEGQAGNLTRNPVSVDTDGDGVPDAQSDIDGDGLGDVCDDCPNFNQVDPPGVCPTSHVTQPAVVNTPEQVLATLTLSSTEDQTTWDPSCGTRTYQCDRLCEAGDSSCVPGPVSQLLELFPARGPLDIVTLPANTNDTDLCRVDLHFVVGALIAGEYECTFCNVNNSQTNEDCGVIPGECDDTGVVCDTQIILVGDTGSVGCSQGFYKNDGRAVPPFANWAPTLLDPIDPFDTVFGCSVLGAEKTLLEALNTGGLGLAFLGRHATAAILNALHPDVAYALAPQTVRALVCDNAGVDPDAIGAQLQALNTGCPLSR